MAPYKPKLHAVMYHYVRDLERSRFPRIKGLRLAEFHKQIVWLASRYEMCSLEAAVSFIRGDYKPSRDLCVLTFDDGLKEHYTDVTPILAKYKIQGLFGVITSCIEDHAVAPVHMNHFLMAEMGFAAYSSTFMRRLQRTNPAALAAASVDPKIAQRSYPLDKNEVASFKFLFNFSLDVGVRDTIVRALFVECFGNEGTFARELYMNWEEIREIQRAGMLIAGHTHWHQPLSTLSDDELNIDLCLSRSLLNRNVEPQDLWPFSYPYGKKNSYTDKVLTLLPQFGFHCAFNTESGVNISGTSMFELSRIDCNGAIRQLAA